MSTTDTKENSMTDEVPTADPIEPMGSGHKCGNCGQRVDVVEADNEDGYDWIHDRTGEPECRPPMSTGQAHRPIDLGCPACGGRCRIFSTQDQADAWSDHSVLIAGSEAVAEYDGWYISKELTPLPEPVPPRCSPLTKAELKKIRAEAQRQARREASWVRNAERRRLTRESRASVVAAYIREHPGAIVSEIKTGIGSNYEGVRDAINHGLETGEICAHHVPVPGRPVRHEHWVRSDCTLHVVPVDSTPRRVTFNRFDGVPLPPNTKLVTRGTPWGNPFKVRVRTIEEHQRVVDLYREFLAAPAPHWQWSGSVAGVREHLAGFNLACNCPPDWPCHADVLLRVAAGGEP